MQEQDELDARLDARLSRALRPPPLRPGFRRRLRAEVERRERSPLWDGLPDVLHLVGGGVATLASALFAPVEATVTLGAGVVLTLGSYVLMTAVRSAIEDA